MKRLSPWLFALVVLGWQTGNSGSDQENFKPYTIDFVTPAAQALLGPTAPSRESNDSCAGVGFDADAELTTLTYEIPSCWTGSSDLTLKVYWCFQSGDAPQLNETIKRDARWRSIDWGTDDADNGTIASGTVTYTESADPGDDKNTVESSITIPYTGGNQPLTAGGVISIDFDRDVSGDTYSGFAIVQLWESSLTGNSLCDHF